MTSENDKNEAMARILLQKSIGSQRISIAANCPIMTLLMNRNDRKTDDPETQILPSANQSEIESLQVELENLLTDAGMRYLNLQKLANPDTDTSKNNKTELGLNTSKLNKSKTSEITREIPFYHLAKPVSFTDIEKRAKLLQDASKEKNISLNPIDKNRNEHLERFWSAVEDFVGSIPQETMEFLKQLSEYDEENDVDVRPKVLVKKESTDTDDLGPPSSKKRKKNAKNKNSKKEDAETPKLTWEYQLQAAENAPISDTLENSNLQVHDGTGFGELTSRIISALVDERIDPEISNSVQKLIQEVAHDKTIEHVKTSPEKSADSENLTINTTQFNNDLEERIALELLQAGLISTSDCVNALGGGNDDTSETENTSETDENSIPSNQSNKTPTTYIDHELTALREQLKIVQKENASTAKVLYQRAIVHNKRHKGLKNLENIDWLLLDYYRKVQASRTRRRPVNRKERETIEELLFKRQDVIDSM